MNCTSVPILNQYILFLNSPIIILFNTTTGTDPEQRSGGEGATVFLQHILIMIKYYTLFLI